MPARFAVALTARPLGETKRPPALGVGDAVQSLGVVWVVRCVSCAQVHKCTCGEAQASRTAAQARQGSTVSNTWAVNSPRSTHQRGPVDVAGQLHYTLRATLELGVGHSEIRSAAGSASNHHLGPLDKHTQTPFFNLVQSPPFFPLPFPFIIFVVQDPSLYPFNCLK